jgi:preprotein translocase subunit SecG
MLYTLILVLQGIVAAALIGVILMQKSEGGGLGVGGSPAGFLSARGAADFLTRATAILATIFVGLCIVLAVLASINHGATKVDADAAAKIAPPPTAPVQPLNPTAPLTGSPLTTGSPATGGADPLAGVTTKGPVAPAAPAEKGVPLQQ